MRRRPSTARAARAASGRGAFRTRGSAVVCVVVCAVVCAVLALSGCAAVPFVVDGASGDDDPAGTATSAEGTQPVTEPASGIPLDGALAGFDRALRSGDQGLLDRVTTAGSDCRRAVRGARAASVTGVRVTAEEAVPDPGTVTVTLTYRTPWDDGPVVEPVAVTVGADGRLSDCSPKKMPSDAVVEPWLVGVPSTARSGRVVVLGDPDEPARADRVARLVAEELPAVEALWGDRDGEVVVYAGTDRTVANTWLGASRDSEVEAAVTPLYDGLTDDARQVGQRLALDPGLRTDGYGRMVLRHELTHVLTSTDDVPVWLAEGAAEFTATRRDTASGAVDVLRTVAARHGGAPYDGRITLRTDDDAFYADSDSGYTDAWLFCLWVADARGEQALVDLYRSVARDGEKRALRAAFGADRAALSLRVRDWVDTWQDDAPTL